MSRTHQSVRKYDFPDAVQNVLFFFNSRVFYLFFFFCSRLSFGIFLSFFFDGTANDRKIDQRTNFP